MVEARAMECRMLFVLGTLLFGPVLGVIAGYTANARGFKNPIGLGVAIALGSYVVMPVLLLGLYWWHESQ
jgi:hypothetical protein